MTLNLGKGLTLPNDAVTQPLAILAHRGAGKSNAAAVLVEEMHREGLPWVVVDPKGDYWGLRSGKDGKGPGLSVPILGGLHGDIPLEPGAGRMIADLIVAQNLTCVLDVSEFDSKGQQVKFLTEFGDRLYRLHGQHPQPRHVVVEEADEVLPQRVMTDMARCVGVWTRMVQRGRNRGLGCTIVSQRSAVVNKDALTQVGTLIVLRTTSPQDRKAIEGWVEHHAVSKELLASLSSLEDGEAWIWSPQWLKRIDRVRFRRRATFDSGATPEVGAGRRVATMADIDLAKVREEMAEVIERARADDPKVLRARITELERELRQRPKAEPIKVEVRVPFVPPEIEVAMHALEDTLHQAGRMVGGLLDDVQIVTVTDPATVAAVREVSAAQAKFVSVSTHVIPTTFTSPGLLEGLGKQPRRMLEEMGKRHPLRLNRRQLSLWTGYSFRSSAFGPSVKALLDAGLVEEHQNGLGLTLQGALLAADGDVEDAASPEEALETWASKLPPQPARFLRTLSQGHLTREGLAEMTGYSLSSSSFGTSVGMLKRAGLVEERDGYLEIIEELRCG